jgi:hypothetical protein
MFITDIFENIPAPYRTEKNDNSVKKMGELRKSRLTLAKIKRFRMVNDLKKFEEQKKVEVLSKQYKPAASVAASGL